MITVQHDVRYFKRFRMEVDLTTPLPEVPTLPAGCEWTPWSAELVDIHARVKQQCFVDELDGLLFPNLVCFEGCQRLVRDIANRWGFRPEATWLLCDKGEPIGTIQGVGERGGIGAIQNVGVTTPHRGRGLGTALVLKSLHAFRKAGLALARLEVTADNAIAVRLYRRLGFRFKKTLYKTVDPLALVAHTDWWI